MKRVVVFDLDGTLCYSTESYPKMFEEMMGEQLNKHANVWLRHMQFSGEHTGIEAVQACFPAMTLDEQEKRLKAFALKWGDAQKLFAGVFSAMNALRAAGTEMIGIMTNGPSQFQWATLHSLGLMQHVDFAHASGDAFPAEAKPSVSLLRKLEARYGFKPDEAVFIGDNQAKDIMPAREAGWTGVHVAPGDHHRTSISVSELVQQTSPEDPIQLSWECLKV